ncbi:MAG: hypothetical protein C4330_10110 [Chitinophagaceae bacterium]
MHKSITKSTSVRRNKSFIVAMLLSTYLLCVRNIRTAKLIYLILSFDAIHSIKILLQQSLLAYAND